MRTALITGATAGFGKAIAESLAKAGYRLIITGRRAERLDQLSEELSPLTKVLTMPFDVRNETEVNAAFDKLPGDWKNIDVLINNAGLALGKAHLESGLTEDWDQMMDTNVKGLLYVTKAALPLLKLSENAHIINIGSIAGTEVYPGGNAYCASKHAVNALSKAMRIELLPHAIRVSQIRPGLADTEFSVVRYKGDKEKADEVYKGFEALQAEDIARAALFILESPRHVCINDLEITPTAQANAYLLEKNL
ncbi:MAG: SDR family NAD(P)-dependent oxidoreductase [Cryomorphaceae bacterium]